MNWDVTYIPEALDDLRRLDGSQRILVRKAIQKVASNPLPENEGGYGMAHGQMKRYTSLPINESKSMISNTLNQFFKIFTPSDTSAWS